MINFSKEYIISAAIHYSKNCGLVPFHSVYGISDGVVITGFRQPLCIQAAVPWINKGYKEVSQGFITSLGTLFILGCILITLSITVPFNI